MTGRYLRPVNFNFEGDKAAARSLEMYARGLIQKELTPGRIENERKYFYRNYVDNNGRIINFTITRNTVVCTIYVPEGGKLKNRSPGAFVCFPYSGWLYPAFKDRRDGASQNLQVQTVPAYYQYRQEPLPSSPYWLDTLRTYKPTLPTEYEIERVAAKDAATTYDPIYVQNTELADTWDYQQDDHYNHYETWRGGSFNEDGEWVPGDDILHWKGYVGGMLIQGGVDDYQEQQWGKFVYVNGVKFPAPGYVYAACVYHDETTGTKWVLIVTWISSYSESYECNHNDKMNVYATRLTTDDTECPIAPNDDATVTVTEYTAAVAAKENTKEIYYNWWPLNDDTDGFLVPRIASERGNYDSGCDNFGATGWAGNNYLSMVGNMCFNQSGNKFAYIAVIEGETAQEMDEFTVTLNCTSVGGRYIPSTFSEALTGSDYINCQISGIAGDWDNQFNGAWHNYQTGTNGKVYTGLGYKQDELQKIWGTVEAKFVKFPGTAPDDSYFQETYINRKWYLNDTQIASDSLVHTFTGDSSTPVYQSFYETGNIFLYFDPEHDDYVEESFSFVGTDTQTTCTYKRDVTIGGTLVSTDSGDRAEAGVEPVNRPHPGGYWPWDNYSRYPWKMNGSMNTHGSAVMSIGAEFFTQPIQTNYTDRTQVGYHVMGGGGPGHLSVHRGHEKDHVMATYCARSINAGPSGIYYAIPQPDYKHPDDRPPMGTDWNYRIKQELYVAGVTNPNKLYSALGARASGDNTVPLLDTCFYRKRKKWSKH